MISELEQEDIKWFIRKLHSQYEQNALIREWCDVQVYFERDINKEIIQSFTSSDESEEDEYIQLGQWTKLPIDIIDTPQMGDRNISQLVRRVTLGERNFLISRLDNHKPIREVTSGTFDFETFKEVSKQVSNPDHLILPLRDDLRDMRRNWRTSNNHYFGKEEYIIANGSKIDIHWYPPDKDSDIVGHGYLIDSDAISITQKWHGDSPIPDAFDHDEDYDEYSRNRPLMVYLGQKTEIDEEADSESLRERIDFLYRTVWSEPEIDSNEVLRFRL